MKSIPCCQNPESLTLSISPFTKIIALGFYDGPTSGILQCQICRSEYRFEMLDWDDDHKIRVFRLALLPSGSLEKCVAVFGQVQAPRWPVWVPGRSHGQGEEKTLQQILAQAQPAELVVAWEGYGEIILAAKKLPSSIVAGVPDWFSLNDPDEAQPWFSMLGLTKPKSRLST